MNDIPKETSNVHDHETSDSWAHWDIYNTFHPLDTSPAQKSFGAVPADRSGFRAGGRKYQAAFEGIRRVALNPVDTKAAIAHAAKEMKRK